ncbi:MAG TPA: chorismate synthase [Actinomycetota bacterium]|nr:chorismate synthase [Actinomycetota bacterium]
MVRILTAGESHGRGLATIVEGLPAGIPVTRALVERDLARRRHGHGRGGRQRFEADAFELLAGVRHGRTIGAPIAITIPNLEFDTKYATLMAPEGAIGEDEKLTRPRPGHADLVGALKYGFDDVRDVLERASARETAARVAAGAICRSFLSELGVQVLSHVVRIGTVRATGKPPVPEDMGRVDRSPVRCADPAASRRMVEEIDRVRRAKDSLGGVFEVLAYGVPVGVGSYVHFDRKLDARLAAALMSIQSVKGVEVGDGFATAARVGSKAHDEIVPAAGGGTRRRTARAGGIEGGMATGQPIRLRAAMKPFSTVPKPLRTVDLRTGEPATAITQRTDACAVPAGGVVGEAVVAHVLADAVLEKFGGDSVGETRANMDRYLEGLP